MRIMMLKERKEIMNSYVGNYVITMMKLSTLTSLWGALGLIGKDSQEFCALIAHLTNKQTKNYIMNKINACCIKSTYCLFCCWDKTWNEPKLLSW